MAMFEQFSQSGVKIEALSIMAHCKRIGGGSRMLKFKSAARDVYLL
jgi:hypothetical protein